MSEKFPNNNAHNGYPVEGEPPHEAGGLPPADTESSREQEPQSVPLIYVESAIDAELGQLHGVWLDAARDTGAIHSDIQSMLAASSVPGAEVFTIRDAEGFGLFDVGRDDSIELVSQVARGIREHGPAYAAWATYNEDDPRASGQFERAYKGRYDALDVYVRHLLAPLQLEERLRQALPGGLDEFASIDYDAIGEQLFARGDIAVFTAEGGGVWIFDERPDPGSHTAGQEADGGGHE